MKKILLVLDLDQTHFNVHKKGEICWLGEESQWIEFYQYLNEMAKKNDIELIFAVVTRKDSVDDICIAAGKAFRPFLEKNNPNMYIEKEGAIFLLVNLKENLLYDELCIQEGRKGIPNRKVFSQFYIHPDKSKAIMISEIASFHDIPHEYCILVDDSTEILETVTNAGMHAISASAFDERLETTLLDDINYVKNSIALIQKNLELKMQELVSLMSPKILEISNQNLAETIMQEKQVGYCPHYQSVSEDNFVDEGFPIIENLFENLKSCVIS